MANVIEVLKQALEALQRCEGRSKSDEGDRHRAITSLRQSIAELESQEPVAWMDADGNVSDNNDHKCFPIPLYTTSPQRTWVGLTGEMLLKAAQSSLSPEQYDHFEAMSKHPPDIYDRLAYAIRVQDE